MQKFFLIDQSIKDSKGHYLSYATAVLSSVSKYGYQPVLMTNRELENAGALPFTVIPAFTYTYWESLTDYRKNSLPPRRLEKLLVFFKNVIVKKQGLKTTLIAKWHRASLSKKAMAILLSPAVAVCGVFLLLLRELCKIRVINRIGKKIFNLFKVKKKYRGELVGRTGEMENEYKARVFAQDLQTALLATSIRQEDILFIPTISEVELDGVYQLLEEDSAVIPGKIHLLFRRNIFEGTKSHYALQDPYILKMCKLFRKFETYCKNGKVCFYTDTEELTEQYDLLSECWFTTLPIPHTLAPEEGKRTDPCLNIVYLGDARTEKGYQYIPTIVDGLFKDYVVNNRCRFLLQSNFNVPGGEDAIREPVRKMIAFDKRYVETYTKPLAKEEYEALSRRADINLILYDANNYYARSSGVFAEAMALGTPVVVPVNTWMSHQITNYNIAYCERLLREYSFSKFSLGQNIGFELRSIRLPLPKKSVTMAIFQCEAVWVSEEDLLIFNVAEHDCNGTLLCEQSLYMERTHLGRTGFSLNITEATASLELSLKLPDGREPLSKVGLEGYYSCIKDVYLPESSVGVAYCRQDEILPKIRELIDHHSCYAEEALHFSHQWRAFHNADNLVKIICKSPDVTYSAFEV